MKHNYKTWKNTSRLFRLFLKKQKYVCSFLGKDSATSGFLHFNGNNLIVRLNAMCSPNFDQQVSYLIFVT